MINFHHLCGKYVSIKNNGKTATKLEIEKEFNNAVVFTNRPLMNGEMFEIQIDKLIELWEGKLELGVSAIKPEDLEFPDTMTDLKEDTWILSGTVIMKNGVSVPDTSYNFDLDNLKVMDKVGMMKHSDGTLCIFYNGEDQGVVFSNLPQIIYGVVDLYGNCCEISIPDTKGGAQVAIKKTMDFRGRPADWNVDTVCDFIKSIPDCAPYAEKFKSEHIDGAALVELDKKDMKDFFEMPLGLAVKISSHLKKIEGKK